VLPLDKGYVLRVLQKEVGHFFLSFLQAANCRKV
jgi:hypothetical protein